VLAVFAHTRKEVRRKKGDKGKNGYCGENSGKINHLKRRILS
jgi:hypothetical protein